MTTTEITVDSVTKRYGEVTSLDDVSLTVPAGTTVGLLGTNGAGKTTLFRLLVGHDRPDAGTIDVGGRSPTEGASIRQHVGYLPENAGFPPSLTGREVLAFHADVRGVPAASRADRIAAVLETVGLTAAADRRVGGYSNGMNGRLGLATVLVAEPRVLLLDEPFSGLDPTGVDALVDVLERLRADTSMTIVLTSHTLTEAERVCERVVILDDGRIQVTGGTDELRRAAGDEVTVAVRTPGEYDLSRALDHLGDVTLLREIERLDDGGLRIRCAREDAFDALGVVHDGLVVEGFEVREPDLGAVFRDAVGPDGEERPGPTSTDRTGGDRP